MRCETGWWKQSGYRRSQEQGQGCRSQVMMAMNSHRWEQFGAAEATAVFPHASILHYEAERKYIIMTCSAQAIVTAWKIICFFKQVKGRPHADLFKGPGL